ncbi:NAD(P)H-binding protein [Chryseobacterium sp. KACC 21268]|nr:NAD(P)H-binding protein [Chryseobacterium sp. KACC 21268]
MKKRIVILGATGTVGSKVAEILLNQGHQVAIFARSIEKLGQLRSLGAEIVKGDVNDVDMLTAAFKNADTAFLILPDNVKAENARAYQRKVTGNFIEAIERSGIKYIVNMSSLGSHMHEGNGMMGGTGEQEVRLNQLEDVNVLHIRSAYFMENFLRTIQLVKTKGINGTAADGDHSIPMVATKDVAKIAAHHLANLDFTGKSIHPVMGPRNYTMREFTSIIGNAIGNPELPYVQIPLEQAKEIFLGNGFTEDFVDNLLEMATGIKEGIFNYEKRDKNSTTSTTAEEFAKEVYTTAYHQ